VGDPQLDGDGQRLTALAIGGAGTCALADDGTPYCWGQLSSLDPEPVTDVGSVTSVVVGPARTCAIRPGGSVVCWSRFEPEPTVVPGLCGATALADAVEAHCAVVRGGEVHCWGGLDQTVFGRRSSPTPVAVPGVRDATAVVVGRSGYTCALIADGSVTCWGGGPRLADRPSIRPAPVPEIAGAVSLSASDVDVCALLSDGSVACWFYAVAPTTVVSLEGVRSFAHAMSHGCAALEDGTVRCWGQNFAGQLGNGTEEPSDTPVVVEGLSGAVAVAVGSLDSTIGHSCALLEDGSARCWGSNASGRLGDGSGVDSKTPVAVRFP
jgi:alpha-tubulin suppressor-like RCC1 family protein